MLTSRGGRRQTQSRSLPRSSAFGILSNLDRAGGQTQQQLADALGIHRNNMVGLIDEMEAAGWVRRHRSQRDRRAFDELPRIEPRDTPAPVRPVPAGSPAGPGPPAWFDLMPDMSFTELGGQRVVSRRFRPEDVAEFVA